MLRTAESRLYRQHQLHLEIGTYRNDAFKPDWYPDPLIPFELPARGTKLEGAHLLAVPFDLPASETHGFWVDLHVPADTPPGDYRGAYRLTAEGGKSLEVPVLLTVWDFTLPQTPTLVTAFGSPAQRMRDYARQQAKAGKEPEPSDWQAVETQCAQLLSEHRFNATPPAEMLRPVAQPDGSFQIPPAQIQALRQFVDRYHVNALQIPHPSGVIKDPQAERDKLRAWLAAFDRAAKELDRPHVVFFVYLKDEPNTREDYEYVQKWGRAIREAKSVVQVMVVEQTWTEPGQGGADQRLGRPVRRGGHLVSAVLAASPGQRRPATGPGRDRMDLHGVVPGPAHAVVAHRLPAAQLSRAGLDGLAGPHEGPALLGRDVAIGERRTIPGCTRPSTPAGARLSKATRAFASTAKARWCTPQARWATTALCRRYDSRRSVTPSKTTSISRSWTAWASRRRRTRSCVG